MSDDWMTEAERVGGEAIYDAGASWLPINGSDCERLARAARDAMLPLIRAGLAGDVSANTPRHPYKVSQVGFIKAYELGVFNATTALRGDQP